MAVATSTAIGTAITGGVLSGAAATTAGAVAIGGAARSMGGSMLSARAAKKAQETARKQEIRGINDLGTIRRDLTEQTQAGTYLGRYGTDDVFGRRPDEVDPGAAVQNAAQANIQNLAANQDLVSRVNQSTTDESMRRASQFDPNFRENIRGLSDQARALLNGEIHEDVLQEITRSRAQFGAGAGVPGAQRTATARDLGLTSLGLQQQGASLFAQIQSIRESVDPLSRSIGLNQLQITPQQQMEYDIANNMLRSSADPVATQLAALNFSGAREEAFARSNVSVPNTSVWGTGLSALGGSVTGGLFSKNGLGKNGSIGTSKPASDRPLGQYGQSP